MLSWEFWSLFNTDHIYVFNFSKNTIFSPQDFPKLSQSYYSLLECLAQDHMTFISNLEPQVFLYILSTISEGLTALGKCVWIKLSKFHSLSLD